MISKVQGCRCLRSLVTSRQRPSRSFSTRDRSERALTYLDLKGTAQILSRDWVHLAPCLGAATSLRTSPLAGNLLRLGMTVQKKSDLERGDIRNMLDETIAIQSAAQLSSKLFYQADRFHPVQATKTQSMVAAHLTPSLMGNILGIAWTTSTDSQSDKALRDLGVKSNHLNGEWTGVSLARWKELVTLLRPVSAARKHRHVIVSLWLIFLWETSTDKLALLEFLLALDKRLDRSVLAVGKHGDALRFDSRARQEWSKIKFSRGDFTTERLRGAYQSLLRCSPGDLEWVEALEVACADAARTTCSRTPVPTGRFGFDGGHEKPDCVEVTVREVVNLMLWDHVEACYDASIIPHGAEPQLKELYMQQSVSRNLGSEWFAMLSNRTGLDYLSVSPGGKLYELTPSIANIAEAIRQLMFPAVAKRDLIWNTLADLQAAWQGAELLVEEKRVSHRAALGEEMVHQEIAVISRADQPESSIEIRMDKAHRISTVSHFFRRAKLHERWTKDDTNLFMKSNEKVLGVFAGALVPNELELETRAPALLVDILLKEYGPDRRGRVVKSSDIQVKRQMEAKAKYETRRLHELVVHRLVRLLGTSRPDLSMMLNWFLNESMEIDEAITTNSSISKSIETSLLRLEPEILLKDPLRASIQSCPYVRGSLLLSAAEIRTGRKGPLSIMKKHNVAEVSAVSRMVCLSILVQAYPWIM